MKLNQILENAIEYEVVGNTEKLEIETIVLNPTEVEKGSIFIEKKINLASVKADIKKIEVKENYAILLDISLKGKLELNANVIYIFTKSVDINEAAIAITFFSNPSKDLKIIGITGSEGRVETAYMLKKVLDTSGFKTAMFTGYKSYIVDREILNNWSNSALEFQSILSYLKDEDIDFVILDLDPIILKKDIILGTKFVLSIYTNLDESKKEFKEHKDIYDYLNSIKKLFTYSDISVVYNDDFAVNYIKEVSNEVLTYGIMNESNVNAYDLNVRAINTNYMIKVNETKLRISLKMTGLKNILNSLAVVTTALRLEIPIDKIKEGLGDVSIPGKFEIIYNNMDIPVLIDNPNLENLEKTIKEANKLATGRKVALISAVGLKNHELNDKEKVKEEKTKRYQIGEILSRNVNKLVLTSGDTYDENPNNIIKDILKGVNKKKCRYFIELDREEGIKTALKNSENRDMISIFGMGDKRFLEQKDKKISFNEKEIIQKYMKEMSGNEYTEDELKELILNTVQLDTKEDSE